MKEIMLYWKMLNVKHSIHHHRGAIAWKFRSSIKRLVNDIQIMIDELQHEAKVVGRCPVEKIVAKVQRQSMQQQQQ